MCALCFFDWEWTCPVSTSFVASGDGIEGKESTEIGAEGSVIGSLIRTESTVRLGGSSSDSKIKETKPKTVGDMQMIGR